MVDGQETHVESSAQTTKEKKSVLNIAAVKRFALVAADKHRKGKFRRVSADFIEAVELEFDETLRKLGTGDTPAETLFKFGEIKPRLQEQLNRKLGAIITTRVKQNITGHTLY